MWNSDWRDYTLTPGMADQCLPLGQRDDPDHGQCSGGQLYTYKEVL